MSNHLYLIKNRELGHTKIGIADNPQDRLITLQCGNSCELILACFVQLDTDDKAQRLETLLPICIYPFMCAVSGSIFPTLT